MLFYKTTQQPRVRQFCVDIAHSFIRRNIDAELLREHCVRRICAHYNFCNFCAISPFASTLASKLRKEKKVRMRKKVKKIMRKNFVRTWIRTRDFFYQGRYANHSATQLSLCTKLKFLPHIHTRRNFGAIFAQKLRMRRRMRQKCANFLRNCAYCAKVGADVRNCALKNHYSALHIKGLRRLGTTPLCKDYHIRIKFFFLRHNCLHWRKKPSEK